jgi:hypothetical protein
MIEALQIELYLSKDYEKEFILFEYVKRYRFHECEMLKFIVEHKSRRVSWMKL